MDTWKWAVYVVLCLIAAGCRTDPRITALERENRMLEDQLYAMDDERTKAELALQACQSTAPRSTNREETSTRSSETVNNAASKLPSLRGPKTSLPNGGLRSPVDTLPLELPDVEVPGRSLPPGELPKRFGEPPQQESPAPPRNGPESLPPPYPRKPATSRYTPSSGQRPTVDARGYSRYPRPSTEPQARSTPPQRIDPMVMPAQAIALDPRADNRRISRLTLNQWFTGGYERDAHYGDAGVELLVEPRDARGQLVPAAGPISVVLLDRGLRGEAGRVARWDFTAEQTALLYRKTPRGEGFFLEMPWPGEPPAHSHLHLFVRYTTKDGRKIEAAREIDVALSRDKGQAWLALNPPITSPQRTVGAGSWQQKQKRDEEPTPPLASEPPLVLAAEQNAPAVIETVPRKLPSRQTAADQGMIKEKIAPKHEASAIPPVDLAEYESSSESSETAEPPTKPEAETPAPPKPKRPVWSPNRP